VIERLSILEFNIDLTGKYVGITDCKSVVVRFLAALIGI